MTKQEEIRAYLKDGLGNVWADGRDGKGIVLDAFVDNILNYLDSQGVRIVKVTPGVYPLIESLIEEIKMPNQEQFRDRMADIIARGREDECISLDIAERIIIHLQGESSPPTFRDGSTLALAVAHHEYPSPTSIEWPYLQSGDEFLSPVTDYEGATHGSTATLCKDVVLEEL